MKGVTAYVDKSRDEQVLYPMKDDEIKDHILSERESSDITEDDSNKCESGVCEL